MKAGTQGQSQLLLLALLQRLGLHLHPDPPTDGAIPIPSLRAFVAKRD